MAKYVHSGKINPGKTLLALVLAVGLGFCLGVLYALVANLSGFIIIDLILMAIVIGLIVATAVGMVRLGVVRNTGVKVLIGLTVSIVSWYTAWVYLVRPDLIGDYLEFGKNFSKISHYLDTQQYSIGKMTSSSSLPISGIGMWILAGIETVLFMIPIFIAPVFKSYYCERCQKFNGAGLDGDKKFYVDAQPGDEIFTAAEVSGNFNDVAKLPRVAIIPERVISTDLEKTIYEVTVSNCKTCGKNGVINVNKGKYKIDDKKKKTEFSGKALLADVIVDDFSIDKLVGETKAE